MTTRRRIVIHGAVQGVGFRPFVYRLATSLRLSGWVANSGEGVLAEVEGETPCVEQFLARLQGEKPAHAVIDEISSALLSPGGEAGFEIRQSAAGEEAQAIMVPDIALCQDCITELFDPSNRRFRYPFINCTNCGPRFSIVEALPYDRQRTTMKVFHMCPACQSEYEDPRDRRFHAQPNACPDCGPQLSLWDRAGAVLAQGEEALQRGIETIRAGGILALKGLGGFQLLADATNPSSVELLRKRKHRSEKPFAVMMPSLQTVRLHCSVDAMEERLLLSAESPIVILRRSGNEPQSWQISANVAPDNPTLGIMLPYTPLHHLLMHDLGIPIVATSGNLSHEPICIDEREGLRRLGGIADLFLIHNRPIHRHADDSVARVVLGRDYVLRRARGYAPRPVVVGPQEEVIAVGAHLKNCVAVSAHGSAFVSQHIGDLDSHESYVAFQHAIADLKSQRHIHTAVWASDLHPDYTSTRYALESSTQVERVQHHFAHVASCIAENHIEGNVLGVSWDGTGYGTDGTIWGGEFLHVHGQEWDRVAAFHAFSLPGADQAVREPRRSAAGMLFALFGENFIEYQDLPSVADWSQSEVQTIVSMLSKGINSPVTSSVGRIFDGVASLCGLKQRASFEGQAAILLEHAAGEKIASMGYPYSVSQMTAANSCLIIDWRPLLEELIGDLRARISVSAIAQKFHKSLVSLLVETAEIIGEKSIVLTGGCFQNVLLLRESVLALHDAGFHPFWHHHVPPNDGGIALGQIHAVLQKFHASNTHP